MLDNKKAVDVLYLDLQKAFDKIPHSQLHYKLLHQFGIAGPLLRWLQDYTTGRRQKVRVGSALSKWRPVTSGVPQGSVLGPLLFIMYMNDIDEAGANVRSCNLYKFADDTKLLCTEGGDDNRRAVLQGAINELAEWSVKWMMPFIIKKTKVVHFALSQATSASPPPFRMGSDDLQYSTCEKDLGVLVDERLSFASHFEHLQRKGMSMCGWIKRVYRSRKPEVLLPLYKAVVRPILEYATPVWSPIDRKAIEKLERVQRHFTKMLVGMNTLSYGQRLEALGLKPTLESRRQYFDMVEVYRILAGEIGTKKQYFLLANEVSARPQRGHKLTLLYTKSGLPPKPVSASFVIESLASGIACRKMLLVHAASSPSRRASSRTYD